MELKRNEFILKTTSKKRNLEFTTTTLAQIAAASSCCSDSENKRYSEKLEIAPKKINYKVNYACSIIECEPSSLQNFASLNLFPYFCKKYISQLKLFIACNCITP